MLADSLTQLFNLPNQFLACHLTKIFVHKAPPSYT
jgi:hypothetical protein